MSSTDEMNDAIITNASTNNSASNNGGHFIDPMLIPPLVRRTLLEIHQRAVVSKSDSNIKAKYRSSNHLLHSPHSVKPAGMQTTSAGVTKKGSKNRKKKPLSLQNSQDNSVYNSVTPKNATSTQHSGNILNMVYDELKSKFFRNNSVETNKSTGSSSNGRAQISTSAFQQQSSTPAQLQQQQTQQPLKQQQLIPMNQLSNTSVVFSQQQIKSSDNLESAAASALPSQTSQLNECSSASIISMVKFGNSATNVNSFRKPYLVSTGCGLNQVGASMSSESDCTVILNVKAMDRQSTLHDAVEMTEKNEENRIEGGEGANENNDTREMANENNDETTGLLILASNNKSNKSGKQV
jgi:hypothetical protein